MKRIHTAAKWRESRAVENKTDVTEPPSGKIHTAPKRKESTTALSNRNDETMTVIVASMIQ